MILTPDVLKNIKQKFASVDGKTTKQKLSDRTLTETIDNLLKFATEETTLEAFVELIFPTIDSNNNNLIKEQSDFVKDYTEKNPPVKPVATPPVVVTPPEGKPLTAEDVAAIVKESLKAELDPVKSKMQEGALKETLEARTAAITEKAKLLDLTPAWGIDFERSTRISELTLGSEATADQVYDHALADFNSTLTRRGEEYKPQKESAGKIEKFDSKSEVQRLKDSGKWTGPSEEK